MPLSSKEIGMCAGFVFLIGVALYIATTNTPDNSKPIPSTQSEDQVMGMGVQSGMRVNAGTPLDCHHETHFWSPGLDPDTKATQAIITPHRYPAIPGGNTSTVMHKGWSAFTQDSPADNDWRLNPPEVAIL